MFGFLKYPKEMQNDKRQSAIQRNSNVSIFFSCLGLEYGFRSNPFRLTAILLLSLFPACSFSVNLRKTEHTFFFCGWPLCVSICMLCTCPNLGIYSFYSFSLVYLRKFYFRCDTCVQHFFFSSSTSSSFDARPVLC